MNKTILVFVLLIMTISGVSANLCDSAIRDGLWESNPGLFDLNEDGATNLSDLALFSSNSNNDTWCDELLWSYYYPNVPSANAGSFTKYNLDKKERVEMSRNVFWSKAREIQYDGERYKVGFGFGTVKLYEKVTGEEVDFPEGLKVEVKSRTLWTRTLVFTKE